MRVSNHGLVRRGGRDWSERESGGVAPSVPISSLGFRDATFANVPLLFNVKLQYPNHSHWTPYVGAGLGVSVAIVDADTFIAGNSFNFSRARARGADVVFAYQAFAGLRYRLGERMGLSVEYRYLATKAP